MFDIVCLRLAYKNRETFSTQEGSGPACLFSARYHFAFFRVFIPCSTSFAGGYSQAVLLVLGGVPVHAAPFWTKGCPPPVTLRDYAWPC